MEYPTLYFMMGLPNSGKDSYIKNLTFIRDVNVHSSDEIRKELFPDEEYDPSHNSAVFKELHKRVKNDLRSGKEVVYNATNVNRKRRMEFLRQLKKIPCFKECVCIMTPYEDCLLNNEHRPREEYVPPESIKRMYFSWDTPGWCEGFDEIVFVFNFNDISYHHDKYTLKNLFYGDDGIMNFNQENEHHTKSLGEHSLATQKYVHEHFNGGHDYMLELAALLHDIGKVRTKSMLNSKGEKDGNCHYYGHEHVGAYDSIFYLNNLGVCDMDMLEISGLIDLHMRPYTAWVKSEKAYDRDQELFGEAHVDLLNMLHEADLESH